MTNFTQAKSIRLIILPNEEPHMDDICHLQVAEGLAFKISHHSYSSGISNAIL